MVMDIDLIIGKDIISSDATILGIVTDIRCEDLKWNILGLKVRTKVSGLNIRGYALLEPGVFTFGDVILISDTMDTVRSKMTPDDKGIMSLSSMIGMKVYASDASLLGTVDSIDIDVKKWKAVSFTVKMDRSAYPVLEVRKGLVPKRISGLKMSDIKGVSDTIVLGSDTSKVKSQTVIS